MTSVAPKFINGLEFLEELARRHEETRQKIEKAEKNLTKELIHLYRTTKADGQNIITFCPTSEYSDENGFVSYEIEFATIRLTGNEKNVIRFMCREKGNTYDTPMGFTLTEDGYSCFAGFFSKWELGRDAQEGTEFRGWKKSKQYKLTKEEIASYVKGTVWNSGSITIPGLSANAEFIKHNYEPL